MVVDKIRAAIDDYVAWLSRLKDHPRRCWWETAQHFQAAWDPQAADPQAMFDACLQNPSTRRLWQDERWSPKRMMLRFWEFDPMTTRMLFADLFDETRLIEARIGRFAFGCDLLLQDYREANPLSPDNDHFHGDYRMICLYLALRYPEAYAPYEFSALRAALQRLGARDIPTQHDPGRHVKVTRILSQWLDKTPEVAPALGRLLDAPRCYQGRTVYPAADLCHFLAGA
ncbi:MAG: hypothetical protein ACK4NS_11995 [Saprospiraceae bacterium]